MNVNTKKVMCPVPDMISKEKKIKIAIALLKVEKSSTIYSLQMIENLSDSKIQQIYPLKVLSIWQLKILLKANDILTLLTFNKTIKKYV